MLLSADFRPGLFQKIALEVEIQILHIGIDFKFRMFLHRGNTLRAFKNRGRDVLLNNALLRKHNDMRFVDIENRLITSL